MKIVLNDDHEIEFVWWRKHTFSLSNLPQSDKSDLLIPGTAKPFENPLKTFGEFALDER